MEYVLVLPGAYLLGSISWGLIIGKMSRGIDVRAYGSGATGVTNVLRTLGPHMAALVLVADVSKGIIATYLARVVTGAPLAEALAGVLVIAGHNWPVFSRFQGGRGVTTAVGAMAVMSPPAAAAGIGAFLPTVLLSRYVSLGSVLSVIAGCVTLLVLVAIGLEPWDYLIYAGVGGPIILWRHRGNLRRLLQGTERRFGQRADQETLDNPSTGGNP